MAGFLSLTAACSGDATGGGPTGPSGGGGSGDGGGSSGEGGVGGGVPCIPRCAGRSCGGDGCGGVCGACLPTELCSAAGACAQASGAPIQVDVAAGPHAIHPEIYGLAFADAQTLAELRVPLNRWGGNSTTRYNWQLDVHNTGADWYFENIVENAGDARYGTPAYVSSADQLVTRSRAAGAASLIAVPTIGWTPKDRKTSGGHTCGFPVAQFGAQLETDPYDANCGNGKSPSGQALSSTPQLTSTEAPPDFERAWIEHLTAAFGRAGAGGVGFYSLDNEMMLWPSTHLDVHPTPVSYDEVWQKTLAYAPAIRAADPGAFVLGYGTWGVLDLFLSGKDQVSDRADQQAHGGLPLAVWYLDQLAAYEKTQGQRLVDCLDVHYYPQGGDSLENTRSLWDPAYRDPSWVDDWLGEPVRLLPRLGEWIRAHDPGLGLCVSEYNFDLNDPSRSDAALAEADVLGLWGVWGVRLASYWTTPVDAAGQRQPAWYGFALYRNYDGQGGAFGETSVGASTTLPSVAVYAATRGSDGALTVVLLNKGAAAQSGELALRGFVPSGAARVYRHVAGESAITAQPDLAPDASGQLRVSLPARSMALLAIPGASAAP